ncbi:inositol-pentakisphosphate 2-kinase-like [Pongo pygmaeus]|uniref:inositol-pentakisphosphate 2-kinase-like n=1 Tax=Pongo pygmaeus TaxID=9600 RepID=UPI00300C1E36
MEEHWGGVNALGQKLQGLQGDGKRGAGPQGGRVQQYRIAMTAKDCSIMIALSPCLQDARSDQRPVIPSSRPRFAFSMSVVDLDLKPYESIPYQYKLDGKIINYYSKTVRAKDDTMTSTRFKESEDCTLVLHKI